MLNAGIVRVAKLITWQWALAAFVTCLLVVLYAVLRPEPPPHVFTHSDKAGHLLGFFALSLSARLAFPRIPFLLFWPFFLVFLGLAPFLEWLQHELQSQRIYDVDDALANVVGVTAADLLGSISALSE